MSISHISQLSLSSPILQPFVHTPVAVSHISQWRPPVLSYNRLYIHLCQYSIYHNIPPSSPILQPSVHTLVSVSHLSQLSLSGPILQLSLHTPVSVSHISFSQHNIYHNSLTLVLFNSLPYIHVSASYLSQYFLSSPIVQPSVYTPVSVSHISQ